MSQVSQSVTLFQNMRLAEGAGEATNWRLRAARQQKESDAGNDINIERSQYWTKFYQIIERNRNEAKI